MGSRSKFTRVHWTLEEQCGGKSGIVHQHDRPPKTLVVKHPRHRRRRRSRYRPNPKPKGER